MALTMRTSPLGPTPAGRFNFAFDRPEPLLYLEPVPMRLRAIAGGETVADSRRAMLLHESGRLPVYWFPRGDVTEAQLPPGALQEPFDALLEGYVSLAWDAMDEWFAEDEQLFGHPKDPYSRIDALKTTRHVRVSLDGELLADTRRSTMLLETALPPRFYIPLADVRAELLVPSPHRSRCAYKGSAAYWHVRVHDRVEEDLVWSYPAPERDAEPVRDLLCFFNERVDLELDGEHAGRPQTQWSREPGGPQGAEALRGLMARRRQ